MKRLLTFAALLAWCCALLALRLMRSHSPMFLFLVWNLFLAVIPFLAALAVEAFERRRRMFSAAMMMIVWLLFLPNAPYIMTDFMHLRARPPIPLWYDVLLLISCAGAGLLLGYGSVMIVQRVIERRFGVRTGWTVGVAAMILSAFGIYLGRFMRFNSWEAFTDPMPLFSDIARRVLNPFDHPRTMAVTALYGIALTLGYVALHVLAETSVRDGR